MPSRSVRFLFAVAITILFLPGRAHAVTGAECERFNRAAGRLTYPAWRDVAERRLVKILQDVARLRRVRATFLPDERTVIDGYRRGALPGYPERLRQKFLRMPRSAEDGGAHFEFGYVAPTALYTVARYEDGKLEANSTIDLATGDILVSSSEGSRMVPAPLRVPTEEEYLKQVVIRECASIFAAEAIIMISTRLMVAVATNMANSISDEPAGAAAPGR